MGCSHAVHLIMNINLATVGRAFAAGALLQSAASDLASLELASNGKNKYDTDLIDADRVPAPDREWTFQHESTLQRISNGSNLIDDFVRVCHETRCSKNRVFIFIHLYSGPFWDGDLCDWVQRLGFL